MTAQKEASAESVFKALTRNLDRKPRAAVERRYQAMVRELGFLQERQNENLIYLRSRKWGDEQFKVLFSLNCIYQEVIGPLDASTRVGSSGIGSTYPITHGAMRFDGSHSSRVRLATQDFFSMVAELGFLREWVTKNTCGDLIYYIARYERDEIERGDD